MNGFLHRCRVERGPTTNVHTDTVHIVWMMNFWGVWVWVSHLAGYEGQHGPCQGGGPWDPLVEGHQGLLEGHQGLPFEVWPASSAGVLHAPVWCSTWRLGDNITLHSRLLVLVFILILILEFHCLFVWLNQKVTVIGCKVCNGHFWLIKIKCTKFSLFPSRPSLCVQWRRRQQHDTLQVPQELHGTTTSSGED